MARRQRRTFRRTRALRSLFQEYQRCRYSPSSSSSWPWTRCTRPASAERTAPPRPPPPLVRASSPMFLGSSAFMASSMLRPRSRFSSTLAKSSSFWRVRATIRSVASSSFWAWAWKARYSSTGSGAGSFWGSSIRGVSVSTLLRLPSTLAVSASPRFWLGPMHATPASTCCFSGAAPTPGSGCRESWIWPAEGVASTACCMTCLPLSASSPTASPPVCWMPGMKASGSNGAGSSAILSMALCSLLLSTSGSRAPSPLPPPPPPPPELASDCAATSLAAELAWLTAPWLAAPAAPSDCWVAPRSPSLAAWASPPSCWAPSLAGACSCAAPSPPPPLPAPPSASTVGAGWTFSRRPRAGARRSSICASTCSISACVAACSLSASAFSCCASALACSPVSMLAWPSATTLSPRCWLVSACMMDCASSCCTALKMPSAAECSPSLAAALSLAPVTKPLKLATKFMTSPTSPGIRSPSMPWMSTASRILESSACRAAVDTFWMMPMVPVPEPSAELAWSLEPLTTESPPAPAASACGLMPMALEIWAWSCACRFWDMACSFCMKPWPSAAVCWSFSALFCWPCAILMMRCPNSMPLRALPISPVASSTRSRAESAICPSSSL